MKSKILEGEIYIFSPFPYEYNPEKNSAPKIGLLLGRFKDNFAHFKYKILGPQGVEELWSNRWAVRFIGET